MEMQRILMRSLAVVVFASVIWTITDAETVFECCKTVSKSKFNDPIISFRMQNKSHQCLKAIIFETERGEFCYDPSQRWVRRKVLQFFRTTNPKPLTSTSSSISDRTRVGGSAQTTHHS